MREVLEERYRALLHQYGFEGQNNIQNVNSVIKKSLWEFVQGCATPALWCYGKHTRMMMAEFAYEMKGVRYVIDAGARGDGESGFSVIGEADIREKEIDGIIISSYIYKEEIKEKLKKDYPRLKYLDLYEKLEEEGVVLGCEFFSQAHPYGHYAKINGYRRKLAGTSLPGERAELYESLLEEYIGIKDFRTAISCLRQYIEEGGSGRSRELLGELESLYELEITAAANLSEHNVLMLCIDGLRRKDILGGSMPGLRNYISQNAYFYQNAYSVSTSTYESLIPTYSENADLRTGYYESVTIPEETCRFMQEARRQNRNVFFYTDSMKLVDSGLIRLTDRSQTATELLWDFILDAADETNGLFYLHLLYESHFSYPNPYTSAPLVADGTSILFDYLSRNGGALRTDYGRQHEDALRYLDDVLLPLIGPLRCRMVMFADHGNIILEEGALLEEIEKTKLTFHEELIRVPLVVKSPETGVGLDKELCSLMDLNHILLSLMNGEPACAGKKDFVKVVRSELYNPDFRYLYQKCGYSRGLLAFEVFLFKEGYKLAIYSDGVSELYETGSDREIEDRELKDRLLSQIAEQVTVSA